MQNRNVKFLLVGMLILLLAACQTDEEPLDPTGKSVAKIGDLVWNDYHPNGILEEGEPGISGVLVRLVKPGNDGVCNTADDLLVKTTTTGENGRYLFDQVAPGDYCVKFERSSLVFSDQDQGDDDTLDSDANPDTGFTDVFTVRPGEVNHTIDAALHPRKTCIGDFVWNDSNRNGLQDPDEPGIPNVTVKLVKPGADGVCGNGDDTTVATTTTDENGFYDFNGLAAGDYCVVFEAPDGFTFSPKEQGDDRADDSNPNPATGVTDVISLESGETDLTIDAGLYKGDKPPGKAALGNRVWNDLDEDGILDAGEPGLPGLEVMLIDPEDGTCDDDDEVLDTFTTNENGIYLFTGLEPGSYCVMFSKPDDFVFSPQNQGGNESLDSDADPDTGKSDIVTLRAGETNIRVDAGAYKGGTTPQKASLGDFVFNDLDQDGVQDDGEPGLAGLEVMLLNPGDDNACEDGDSELATTTTGEDGRYTFNDLTPGQPYCVMFNLPDNFVFSPQDQGDDDSDDSDANPENGKSQIVTLSPGENNTTVDAGGYKPAPERGSIGDRVFRDLDEDGIQDAGEPGVPGVSVELQDCDGNVLETTTTDDSGTYLFDDLEAGCYRVSVSPNGFTFSPQDQGDDDSRDSDVNPDTGVTGNIDLAPGEDDLSNDAGVYEPAPNPASLGDRVFNDLNRNGVQDPGEPGLRDLEVMLLDPGDDGVCADGDSELATTTTDPGGIYRFTNLTPGQPYCVMFNLPDGFVYSPQNQGDNDATDSDANPENGKSQIVTLSPGENNSTVDAGGYRQGNPGIDLVKTVGTDADECASENDITVFQGATVYYCYTVTNTGDVTLSVHDLTDDQLGTVLEDFEFELEPGQSVNTVAAGVTASAEITDDTTNVATWTGTTDDGREVSDTDDATVTTRSPVCSLDLSVTADPISITPGPPLGCGFGDDKKNKPTNLTFRYTGGSCAASNNSQDKKFECSGAATSDTVTITSEKGKTIITPSTVSLGEEFTIRGEKDKLESGTELNVGGQFLDIHTSCSAPIRVGDVYGGLTLVAFNGQRATDDEVTFTYEVTNDGDTVTDASISDSFGSVDDDFELGAGESVTFTRTQNITSTTTNTVNVTSLLQNGATCEATDSAEVTVNQPVGGTSCEDGKPQRLVFEYTGESCSASNNTQEDKFECSGSPGSGTVSISLEKDSDKINVSPGSVSPGDSVTISGEDNKGKLKSSVELNVGGQFLDIHTSCSAPLQVGDQFGSLILREFVPEDD